MPKLPTRRKHNVRWAVFDAGKPRDENPVLVAGTRREAGRVAARLTSETGRIHFRAPIGPNAVLPANSVALSGSVSDPGSHT